MSPCMHSRPSSLNLKSIWLTGHSCIAIFLRVFAVDTVRMYIIVSMNQDDRPGLGQDEPGSDE